MRKQILIYAIPTLSLLHNFLTKRANKNRGKAEELLIYLIVYATRQIECRLNEKCDDGHVLSIVYMGRFSQVSREGS